MSRHRAHGLMDRGAHRDRRAILRTLAGRCVLLGLAVVSMAAAADPILERVDAEGPAAVSMAERLWALAELGYQETRSAQLLADYLVDSGFAESMEAS